MQKRLDKKDQRIIKELFDDARKPYSEIAKKVRLSKEGVAYRIKKLQENALITGFNTVIDVRKIGWEMFLAYIKLDHIDLQKDPHIIETIRNNPHVAWQVRCIGQYDIILKVFAKDHMHINQIMKDLESSLKPYIDSYVIDYLIEDNPIPKTFLYPDEKRDDRNYIERGKPRKVPISTIDKEILNILSKNSRTSITDIAKQLDRSRELVKYHLKKLETEKIILKYRPEVWSGVQEQGYNWYFVIFKLEKLTPALEKTIHTFIVRHKNINFFYKTIGTSDLQIEIQTKTTLEFNKILMEIRSLLRNVLKGHDLLMILNEQKFTYFPKCLTT